MQTALELKPGSPLEIPPAATHKNGTYVIAWSPEVRRRRRPDFHCRIWRSEALPFPDHAKIEFFFPSVSIAYRLHGLRAQSPNATVESESGTE